MKKTLLQCFLFYQFDFTHISNGALLMIFKKKNQNSKNVSHFHLFLMAQEAKHCFFMFYDYTVTVY